MLSSKKYYAFFDLDRTIINVNSGSLLVRQAYKNRIMGPGDVASAIIQGYLYKFNLRDTNLIISKMGTWLKEIPLETIKKLCTEVTDSLIINSIRPEIIKEITFHKENDAGIIILSSAITMICNPIGSNIGADGIICTTMENIDGILTGKPLGKYCFEVEKKIQLLAWCEKHDSDPASSWYYADSITDLHALEAVGNPVCVSPDKKLTRIANERGWKVLKCK